MFLYKWLFAAALLVAPAASPAEEEQNAAGSMAVHPFYVSVFEIHHNAGEKALEITCKIFADDFENTLKQQYKTVIDFSSEKDKARIEGLIADYLSKNLQLTADGKLLKLKLLGFEREQESVYSYLEVEQVATVKKLDIRNTVLYDFTKDQANIMHVIVNGKRKSNKLDYPKERVSFEF